MNKNIFAHDEWKRSEHMAVRECVGYYLFTHQIMEVTGPDACRFLDYMYPNNIANLAVGRDRYTTMLNDDGEIIDDVVIMRLEEEKYWVSTLYGTQADDWFYFHSEDYDLDASEITDEWHMFAVQGPKSKDVMNSILEGNVDDLKFFMHKWDKLGEAEVLVNRGGFTGEKFGYEVYCTADDADAVQDAIDAAVRAAGGAWCLSGRPCTSGSPPRRRRRTGSRGSGSRCEPCPRSRCRHARASSRAASGGTRASGS